MRTYKISVWLALPMQKPGNLKKTYKYTVMANKLANIQ